MNQKIWVIPDEEWANAPAKSRIIEERKRDNPPEPIRSAKRRATALAPKNPAWAFSFSMLVWGSGQMYGRDYAAGAKFMAAMLFFYAAISWLAVFPASACRFVADTGLPVSVALIGFGVFLMMGLVVWLHNAADAYFRTVKSRSEPFLGVRKGLWPLLGSFLFPGWGQFLNGQPRKGIFFLAAGFAGLSAAGLLLAVRAAWPFLQSGQERLAMEIYLAAAAAAIPLALLMWIVSIYDAFCCRGELSRRKPGFPDAGPRARRPGGVQGLAPRGTAILWLLLAISVGMQSIPSRYYLDTLESLRLELLGNHMELIPELLGKAVDFIGR